MTSRSDRTATIFGLLPELVRLILIWEMKRTLTFMIVGEYSELEALCFAFFSICAQPPLLISAKGLQYPPFA